MALFRATNMSQIHLCVQTLRGAIHCAIGHLHLFSNLLRVQYCPVEQQHQLSKNDGPHFAAKYG